MMHVVAGALMGRDGWLVARRAHADKAYPGCWEFPGGKVDAGEDDVDALRREWQEELGLEVWPLSTEEVTQLVFAKADGYQYDVTIRLYVVVTHLDLGLDYQHNTWPTHMPDHSAALYMPLDAVARMQPRDCTPSLQPFAKALCNAMLSGKYV